MSLGILDSPRPLRASRLNGLGAVASTIPAECWSQPGFKDAHAAAYKKAQAQCVPNHYPFSSEEACLVAFADSYAKQSCGSGATQATGSGGFTWKNTTPNPTVKALQLDINKVLTKNGYASIGTDGKLGPGTCGGARVADRFGGSFMSKLGGVCQSFSEPAKIFSAPSTSSLEPLEPTQSSASFISGVSNKNLLLIGLAAAAAAYLFATQDKSPKRA